MESYLAIALFIVLTVRGGSADAAVTAGGQGYAPKLASIAAALQPAGQQCETTLRLTLQHVDGDCGPPADSTDLQSVLMCLYAVLNAPTRHVPRTSRGSGAL